MDVDLTEREGGEILKLMVLFQIFACSSFHILYLTLISQHIPLKKLLTEKKEANNFHIRCRKFFLLCDF